MSNTNETKILDCNHPFVEQMVEREVIHLLTPMVSFAFEHESDATWWAEIEELRSGGKPDYQTAAEDEGWENYEDERGANCYRDRTDNMSWACSGWRELCEEFDIEPYYPEIYEYWAVSDRLAYWLKEKGEHVVGLFGFNVWGRQTSGQSITLDYVIRQIATEWDARLNGSQEG